MARCKTDLQKEILLSRIVKAQDKIARLEAERRVLQAELDKLREEETEPTPLPPDHPHNGDAYRQAEAGSDG